MRGTYEKQRIVFWDIARMNLAEKLSPVHLTIMSVYFHIYSNSIDSNTCGECVTHLRGVMV